MKAMLKTGLEFAPGTTDACKRIVARMFKPADLLEAYREARSKFGPDIVLAASDQFEGILYITRLEYGKHLQSLFGHRASEFKMWSSSAQSVMKLPLESSAFWLVIEMRGADMPIMCVIFAVPYKTDADAEAPAIQ